MGARQHTEVRWLDGAPSADARARVEALLVKGEVKPSGTQIGDVLGVTRGPFSVVVSQQAGRSEVRVTGFARQRDIARAITVFAALIATGPATFIPSSFDDLRVIGWVSVALVAVLGLTLPAWGRWRWKKRAIETRELADRVALALAGPRELSRVRVADEPASEDADELDEAAELSASARAR